VPSGIVFAVVTVVVVEQGGGRRRLLGGAHQRRWIVIQTGKEHVAEKTHVEASHESLERKRVHDAEGAGRAWWARKAGSAGSAGGLHGGLAVRRGEVSGVTRLSRRLAASFCQLIVAVVAAAPASGAAGGFGAQLHVCTLFYQVSPTLHAPATMVAVMTLAGGGGRVTVGGRGGGGEQRAAHCRG
jgi:hypothetical protein